jgi:hypothetical protein
LPDGTIVRTDPRRGTVQPIYQAPTKAAAGVVGTDKYGQPVHGFVDPATKQAWDISGKPITAGAAPEGTGGASPASDLTGEDYLKTLDKPRADQVRALVEGRLNPPGSFALKTPYWQRMLQDAAQYEPGFDFTKWGQRAATAKDFGSGKSAQNITSFNTAIGHLGTLSDAAEKLNNTWSPHFNTVANWVAGAKGDPRINEFNVAKTAVADELTRAFRGTGGNVHDLVQWEKAINAAGSPEQLNGAIKQAVELLRSRIEALGDTYRRGMNTNRDAMDMLSPKAKETLLKLSGERPEKATAGITSGAPAADKVRRFNPETGKIE